MKIKYDILSTLLVFLMLCSTGKSFAQRRQHTKYITIDAVVQDNNGNPISGATISANDGWVVAFSDDSGKFTISVPDQSDLSIKAPAFEPVYFQAGEFAEMELFQLEPHVPLYSKRDSVNIAFGRIPKGNLIGSATFLVADDIIKYDNTQWLSDALLGRIPGLLGYNNIRGLGNALFIVDGLPRDIWTINLAEVEQISVLKDINSAMLYGSEAVNGVVLITTKRGNPNKSKINVTAYYGVSLPMQLPKYLSSADYMTLYNEARVNDGLTPLYKKRVIENYRKGHNIYRYPDIDYYSNDYLKSYKPFAKGMAEFSGGNNTATYYTNMGWEYAGSLLNFGEGRNGRRNRFNLRGNVDLNVNSFIKASLDAVAVFSNDKEPVGDYWSNAATLKPNLFSPLLPIKYIVSTEPLLKSRKNDVGEIYLLGGTQSYLTNPIADGYSGGTSENIQRNFSLNNRIDFDLSDFLNGLAFHTNISFDYFTNYDQRVANEYSVYEPTWNLTGDSIVALVKYGNDSRPGTQSVSGTYYQRRFGFYGLLDYNRIFNEVHQFTGSLLGFANSYKMMGDYQSKKNANFGLRLNYIYNRKYMVDFSSAYVNSVKLPPKARRAFSPSFGLAWMISSEDFMSSAKAIDYLKLRLTGGIINYDAGIGGFFDYIGRYAKSTGYQWNELNWGNEGVVAVQGENNVMGFEKRRELNIGIEGSFFHQMLALEANIFSSLNYDMVTRAQTIYPTFYSQFIPYVNFDKNAYKGAEIGLTFNRKLGDFRIVVGANALYTTSEVIRRDEIYADAYQYRQGRSVDARFGLVAAGLFMDEEEISNSPTQTFGTVKPGDIKYVDQNNDGVININDEVQIGRWQAPFSYGLHLCLTYKNVSFYALGNGRKGADSYINGNYYWVDGDKKYSEYILNRWTEETKTTATYPRLTTMTSTNNFRNSTFWLYRDDYFTLQRAQLTYEFPKVLAQTLQMKNISCFLDGSGLFTVSKYRDIKELRVGSEPNYRSFSVGLKMQF